MTRYGYFLSSEEYEPASLVRQAVHMSELDDTLAAAREAYAAASRALRLAEEAAGLAGAARSAREAPVPYRR